MHEGQVLRRDEGLDGLGHEGLDHAVGGLVLGLGRGHGFSQDGLQVTDQRHARVQREVGPEERDQQEVALNLIIIKRSLVLEMDFAKDISGSFATLKSVARGG